MDRRDFMLKACATGGLWMSNTGAAHSRPIDSKLETFTLDFGTARLHIRRRGQKGAPPVLYIHGATIASALCFSYRFDDKISWGGISWEDYLCAAGFEAWSFDFEGFGCSSRPDGFPAQLINPL
jgi:pimeloyl-ACP methyl ester carboxylesterase